MAYFISPIAPLVAALLACATLGTAHAHQVWLENDAGQVRLHFGEFNENLREISPGRLDQFIGVPVLHQGIGPQVQRVQGKLGTDAFSYATSASANTLWVAVDYPLIDRSQRNLPAMLWQPSARWVAGLTEPVAPSTALALDLVPTGQPGQLQVVFKGAPLAKAKVQLIAPSGWAHEATSADDGTVHFLTPWKGQYVAEVKHSDKTPGQAQGASYGEASYVTTLGFVQVDGMASPPLPQPRKAP